MSETQTKRARVLVVDDSEIVLATLKLVLEDAGYEVVTHGSPFGTSSVVLRERPDLLLLDVGMPGLAGDKIVAAIRGSSAIRHTQILLYSAREPAEIEALVASSGADGYVVKNSGYDDLLERVGAAVKRARQR